MNDEAVVEKLLLTVQDVAEMLSISRAKLYELLGGGVIESVKLEGSRRIPREALDEYVERLRRAS
jgi:excisionase family DNA binding protein